MDFAFLPPEVNSARMYAGPGAGSLLAAAGSWDSLAAELAITAEAYDPVLSSLTAFHWRGPASEVMAANAARYMDWLQTTTEHTKQTAMQARTAAAAYEQACSPPWERPRPRRPQRSPRRPGWAAPRPALAAVAAWAPSPQRSPAPMRSGRCRCLRAGPHRRAGPSRHCQTAVQPPWPGPTQPPDPQGDARPVRATGGTLSRASAVVPRHGARITVMARPPAAG